MGGRRGGLTTSLISFHVITTGGDWGGVKGEEGGGGGGEGATPHSFPIFVYFISTKSPFHF